MTILCSGYHAAPCLTDEETDSEVQSVVRGHTACVCVFVMWPQESGALGALHSAWYTGSPKYNISVGGGVTEQPCLHDPQ